MIGNVANVISKYKPSNVVLWGNPSADSLTLAKGIRTPLEIYRQLVSVDDINISQSLSLDAEVVNKILLLGDDYNPDRRVEFLANIACIVNGKSIYEPHIIHDYRGDSWQGLILNTSQIWAVEDITRIKYLYFDY